MVCTGYTVQPIADYGTSCPTTCDGLTNVPNSAHTACGKSSDALRTSNDYKLLQMFQCVPLETRCWQMDHVMNTKDLQSII